MPSNGINVVHREVIITYSYTKEMTLCELIISDTLFHDQPPSVPTFDVAPQALESGASQALTSIAEFECLRWMSIDDLRI